MLGGFRLGNMDLELKIRIFGFSNRTQNPKTRHISETQRNEMNARLVWILVHESIKEASERLPLDAPLLQLVELKESDKEAACTRHFHKVIPMRKNYICFSLFKCYK